MWTGVDFTVVTVEGGPSTEGMQSTGDMCRGCVVSQKLAVTLLAVSLSATLVLCCAGVCGHQRTL